MDKSQVVKPTRRARRFFSIDPLTRVGQEIELLEDQAYHLHHILRLKPGDRCALIDGKGREAKARVQPMGKGSEIRLLVEKIEEKDVPEDRLPLRVFLAVPQRGKMDDLIEKAQELGVDELSPMETARTVVRMSEANKEKVLERWQRIAREASKQSGAPRLLKIHSPCSFVKALGAISKNESLTLFHPQDTAMPFGDWIAKLREGRSVSVKSVSPSLNLFFGPEGGFTTDEIRQAGELKRISFVTLGRNVLKVDTAFLGVVSSLRFLFP